MATNNIFKTSGASARERKMLTINDFGGVDYMANPLAISSSRAVEMKNFIKRDGVNQKRFGWQQIGKIKGTIRNIWNWFDKTNNEEHFIAYTGNGKFYEIFGLKKLNLTDYSQVTFDEIEISGLTNEEIEKLPDKELQAFACDKGLYILTGVKYLVAYYRESLSRLEISTVSTIENDEQPEVYIPTVLTGIPRRPTPLDDYNILSHSIRVKGTFYTTEDIRLLYLDNPQETSDRIARYMLSNKLINLKESSFNFIFEDGKADSSKNDFYSLITDVLSEGAYQSPRVVIGDKTTILDQLSCIPRDYSISERTGIIALPHFSENSSFENYNKIQECEGETFIGFADENFNFFITNIDGKAVLYDFSAFKFAGEDFEVEYDYKERSTHSFIDGCTFGCLYGNNNNNTLFISGNPEAVNVDYHTSGGIGDFSYFSDLDYCAYGTPLTAIKGYNVMNDGQLCVLKEDSTQEPTIYFRTSTFMNATAYDGTVAVDINGTPLIEEQFPLTTGNIGEGLINTNSFKTFVQDTVFLSKNGLFGITTGSNVNSNVKTTRERSRFINPRLTENDLSTASTIIHENKYYISVKDEKGTVYIADSRYKTELTDDLYTWQYDWWVWENVHAEHFFTFNDKLYFSKNDGTLNEFKLNNFSDINVKDNCSIAYDLSSNDYVFESDVLPKEANYIYITHGKFFEGNFELNKYLPITILSDREFMIVNEQGEPINITKVEIENGFELSVKFLTVNPVESLYETVPFSFGTTLHSKYLYQYSLTNNTIEGSKYSLGIRTSDALFNPYDDVTDYGSVVNFEYFNFMDISFAKKDFARSYIYKYRIPNINFVQFLFWSRDSENCSVSSLQLLYTIGLVQKGVR